ncbi:FecR domain-containing protein [Maribellus sp. YY47]|uniref:FecR family protein n=1 Tax=Maribellus sp. YY47 TaxID=2929486 RepID=UPI002000AF70|nr:FecR domain-containing protein [Maribellus sp. YY47]MCK3684066.1 FecR domain-containing protein [Maribellus sp. YY47]
MDKFLKYYEDQNFVRWVLNPTKDLDEYWNDYIKKHEDEQEQIRVAHMIVSHLQSTPTPNVSKVSKEVFTSILKELDNKGKKSKKKIILFSYFRYAAVGILFFVLGVAINQYLNKEKNNGLQQSLQVSNNPAYSTLILSDGSNVQIPDKKSEIEYKSNGQIVINKKDTVRSPGITTDQNLNELFVPYGKNASIKLPDGTLAHLNAGSRLIYPSKFQGSQRTVSLIGEGYFEVVHNSEMPFIVKTEELNIEVLGTKFDLSAYPTDKIVETILVEGKVKISKPGFHLGSKDYVLEPNQRAAFNVDTKETDISNVDVENYVSWHEGYMIFETQELNRVIKKIERYYNIRIGLVDPTLGFLRITGKLELKEDKETVLNIFAKAASLDLVHTNETEYVLK